MSSFPPLHRSRQLPSAGVFVLLVALQLRYVVSLEWVLGQSAESCQAVCASRHASCSEDPNVWPANEQAFVGIVTRVKAVQDEFRALAVRDNKTKGTSAYLFKHPEGPCTQGISPGGAAHEPSMHGGVCGWQATVPLHGGRCAVGAPQGSLRFCPCEPKFMGTTDGGACQDQESCLNIVDSFLDAQPRAFGLLRVRGHGNLGGGSCGGWCVLPGACPEGLAKCRYDTYDNALAALYYTKRGHLEKAKQILDAFISILYPESPATLKPNNGKTLYDNLPSGRTLALLASSFNGAHKPEPGNYQAPFVTDGGVDTGNNAWVAIAFAQYGAAAQAPCYATVARDMLAALSQGGSCHDKLGGFEGHMQPYPAHYRATEHNVDMFGLGQVLDNEDTMRSARKFVTSQYARNRNYNTSYSTGTGAKHNCDHSQDPGAPAAVDATFWNILAGVDTNISQVTNAVKFALRTPGYDYNGHPDTHGLWVHDNDLIWTGGDHPRFSGFRFSSFGNGVQWENTAGAVMAMIHFQKTYGDDSSLGLSHYIEASRHSLRRLLGMYGGTPSSVLGGNYAAWQSGERRTLFPGGSDTGIGWPYLRYLATAPTAWTGLLLLYQTAAGQAVNEDANPYVVPQQGVPQAVDLTCLPAGQPDFHVAHTRRMSEGQHFV